MFQETPLLDRPLRWGMVGGGRGSQIGYPHRDAAARDGLFTLCAGAFDLDAERGRRFGVELGLDPQRCYPDYRALIDGERQRRSGEGIEVLSVATPNNTHYEICKAALAAGLHVVCEKPLTLTEAHAEELARLADEQNRVLAVMYGYSGYPMVHQARAMVANGDIGEVRIVQMQFAHGYHAAEVERDDPGARWRVTESVAGPTYVIGDLGTHCFQLGSLISGLTPRSVCCLRRSFVASRAPLEDDAHVLLQYPGGAVGTLWASAVNVGAAHAYKVKVIGSTGSVEWWDEHPNQLRVTSLDGPEQIYERSMSYLHADANFARVGGGHPEGFFDSWANLYRRFAVAMSGRDDAPESGLWYPSVADGLLGVKFMLRCAESADADSRWVNL